MEKDLEKQFRMLERLSYNEDFQVWRDLAAKPVMEQIKAQLQSPLELSEANLKALVMYQNLVESLFFTLFEQVKQQNEIDRQQEAKKEQA